MKWRKGDGSNETEIASVQTATLTTPDNGTTNYNNINVELPVTTIQHFAAGETLRLTVELWGQQSGGSTVIGLLNDPANRTVGTADHSNMQLFIPFLLDL